jgi:hypothetical protein
MDSETDELDELELLCVPAEALITSWLSVVIASVSVDTTFCVVDDVPETTTVSVPNA